MRVMHVTLEVGKWTTQQLFTKKIETISQKGRDLLNLNFRKFCFKTEWSNQNSFEKKIE